MKEFFHMGGYAFYVWMSYGIALIILLINFFIPMYRRREILRDIARKARRAARKIS